MHLKACEIYRNTQSGEVILVINGRWNYLYGPTMESIEKVRSRLLHKGRVPDALVYEIAPAYRHLLEPAFLQKLPDIPMLRKAV
jgi:hypothetical protein